MAPRLTPMIALRRLYARIMLAIFFPGAWPEHIRACKQATRRRRHHSPNARQLGHRRWLHSRGQRHQYGAPPSSRI